MWFASLEYANQVSSLTTSQSIEPPDGAYYSVIAREDPGYANWLDTGGLDRGIFQLRYDGVSGDVPKAHHPSAKLVGASALPDLIPGYTRSTGAQREATRAARRRHVQVRNHRWFGGSHVAAEATEDLDTDFRIRLRTGQPCEQRPRGDQQAAPSRRHEPSC